MEVERAEEIEPLITNEESSPNPNPKSKSKVRFEETKSPEIEVTLYRNGKGPIAIFRSKLGGWDQDRLEVQEILDKYGFKSLYAFNSESGRGVPIRFSHKNGRSLLPYSDGSVILVDGEPKDSVIKPITKILLGVAVLTLIIAVFMKEKTPQWAQRFNFSKFSNDTFPPWVFACIIIVFTRLRKRTKNLLKKFGW